MDNLESSTYEVFEKDPVKYAQYEEAMRQALLSAWELEEEEEEEEEEGNVESDNLYGEEAQDRQLDKEDRKKMKEKAIVVMVVGAGRGPLVRAALRASDSSSVPVRVYAVEKNPNAVVTLKVPILWSFSSLLLSIPY